MRAPEFWNRRSVGIMALLLSPMALLYRLGFLLRAAMARPRRASVPVLCIGAASVGGAGKTPLAFAIARQLRQQGRKLHIVSRGYGGNERGPLRVDPARHLASEVGDEALLLTQAAPVWVARDRLAGIEAAAQEGADLVLLDDGLQNPTLAKTASILTVDGITGFGNGWLLPAGPLREPVGRAAQRCQAVVIVGADEAEAARRLPAALPRFAATLEPIQGETLKGKRWYAFCGLGSPEKFRRTIRGLGLDVAGGKAFPDHHRYSDKDLAELRAEAERANARLLTTRKDWLRLKPDQRGGVTPLDIVLRFEDEAAFDALLQRLLAQ